MARKYRGAPPPLYKHQKASIAFMRNKSNIFDTSDPGTGKTRVQIELTRERRSNGEGCTLVLAPKSLLRPAWEDDFNSFAPELTISVATAANREKAFEVPADVYVTNIDAATWLAKQKPTFFKRFDTLIIDEISGFKHRTSKRSKAVNKIKKHFKYRAGMTGTPNTNTLTDLWHQVYILDDGDRLGKSFFAFRASVCNPIQNGPQPNMLRWDDRPGADAAVAMLLSDIVIRHKFEECLDIPANVENVVHYYMSKKQLQAYKEVELNSLAQIKMQIVSAVNAAALGTKLLQIASGAVYDESGKAVIVDTGRYELVADLIEERANCVVFFNWTHQRDALIAEFESRGITYALIDGTVTDKQREAAVKYFQAGFYKVLLAHPASAAHGLTLTKGTTTIWASPTYNLEHFIQGNRRIYRAGQMQRTETIVIVAPGTIEEKVMAKLLDKEGRQTSMLELLKENFDDSNC